MSRIWSGTAMLSIVAAMGGCSSGTTPPKGEVVGETASALAANVQFGTRCQQDYQNTWLPTNANTWDSCSGFNNSIGGISPVKFYYNLHGAQVDFQTRDTCGYPCGNVDAVDFFYFESHGGSDSTASCAAGGSCTSWWSMWDDHTRAWAYNMRLGDSGREAMVYATHNCDTDATDAYTFTRLSGIFKGGLVEMVGPHALMYAGTPNLGGDFANRMKNGEAIGQSWLEATYYADNRNTPTVLTTGHSPSGGSSAADDCWNRMGTNLDQLLGQLILRDADVQTICSDNWN